MKKFVCAILTMVLMLTVTTGAMAQGFTLNVPCQTLSDDQLYLYHTKTYVMKYDDTYNIVWVKHRVTQTSTVETNRIAAYCSDTQKTSGANWHRADYGKYQCMSNAIFEGYSYSVAGRGNTNYTAKYGLNNITLEGDFDPN